jgi:hypothetical protein
MLDEPPDAARLSIPDSLLPIPEQFLREAIDIGRASNWNPPEQLALEHRRNVRSGQRAWRVCALRDHAQLLVGIVETPTEAQHALHAAQ